MNLGSILEPWMERAACQGADLETFFPEKAVGVSTKRLVAEAKAICATCPVRSDCLEYAVVNHERFGVWGGKTDRELRQIRRSRRLAGTLAPRPSNVAGPLIHGSGTNAYQRCRKLNGEACRSCKNGHMAAQQATAERRGITRRSQAS